MHKNHKNIYQKLAFWGGITYVLAWIVGLSTGVPNLKLQATGTQIAHAYTTHQVAAYLQFIIAEGLTAVALAVTLFATYRLSRSANRPVLMLIAGLSAALISVIMCVGGVWLIHMAPHASLDHIRSLYGFVNRLDGPKMWILALMGMSGVQVLRKQFMPAWLSWAGIAMAITLLVSGIAYGTLSDTLQPSVYVSGILLLLWVCSTGIVAGKRA